MLTEQDREALAQHAADALKQQLSGVGEEAIVVVMVCQMNGELSLASDLPVSQNVPFLESVVEALRSRQPDHLRN